MMLGDEQTALFLRLVTIVVPMGVYFLLLGLFNSRRHPLLLSGRQDFTLLLVALTPMLLLPVLSVIGASPTGTAAAAAAVLAVVAVLAPRPGRWVIYNLPADQARQVVRQALEALGLAYEDGGGLFRIGPDRLPMQVSAFPLLRNVSIRIVGAGRPLQQLLGDAIERELLARRAETRLATVALMLVAIAMMVAPLVLVAHRAGEIVRIVVDLLP